VNQKLSTDEIQGVVDKMKHHQSLIKNGNYKDARQCGPKVIAFEYGISPQYTYVLAKKHG